MDETEAKTFSFSKAYDHFKTAASLGHTLAAYNIGVMQCRECLLEACAHDGRGLN